MLGESCEQMRTQAIPKPQTAASAATSAAATATAAAAATAATATTTADAAALSAEFERRLAVYANNVQVAAQLSAADAGGAQYGASPFADLTSEEFASGRLMTPLEVQDGQLARSCLENGAMSPPPPTLKAGDLPATWDWRDKGAVTPVRDQAQCGSCWAFSTAENIEGLWALAGNPLTVLSPQDIVDCSHGCAPEADFGPVCNSGCEGGWPWSAYMDIIGLGGLASESDYPYTGLVGTCAFRGTSEATAKIANYTCLPSDEAAIAAYLVAHGPISVALDARWLQLYTGGVYDPPLCSKTALDHAVLLVGYGTEEGTGIFSKGKDYWLVKNSWTEKWGDAGYFKIARGNNTCGIANAASSAILRPRAAPLSPTHHGLLPQPPPRRFGFLSPAADGGEDQPAVASA